MRVAGGWVCWFFPGLLAGAAIARAPELLHVAKISAASFVAGARAEGAAQAGGDQLVAQMTLLARGMATVSAAYVDPVSPRHLAEAALRGMLSSLDPHSAYMSAAELAAMDSYAQARRVGIGAELAKDAAGARIVSLIDGGPAQLAGLHTGDRLAAIDGASLDAAALLDISGRLQGAAGSKVSLRVLREGAAPWSVVLVRASVATPSVRSAAIGHVGYVRIYSFANDTAPALRKALTGFAADAAIHGLVLDLRDNPGGLVDAAQAVCSAFLGSGKILSMRPRRAEDTVTLSGDGTALATGLPLVVLINEATASASEIVAGALQDRRRGVIVGVRSFGKGSVQTVLPLGEGEGALRLTTARYYTPGGRSIQGSGIDPDIVAWPSRAHAASAISREADLGRVLAGQGGVKLDVQRRDLAAIARGIAPLPPPGWQAADGEPQGDYPLHAGIEVIDALAAAPAAGKP